ncbi:flagellar hook-basal body protein FliE [Roseimaritima multifibrata]|uniref:Flagellar hook-basal body complex protein FliE n=1 Tax=Roseimaritima multifibrata TaxID=1930274 RepID=A0A517MKQ1_9BACT|nr:flagellar hook-basal body complex protein FliE [Roseimaritima multifibrata]QDS95463.1 flagellar hook-basal body protein FliE [Roseimaritima multifibrata]
MQPLRFSSHTPPLPPPPPAAPGFAAGATNPVGNPFLDLVAGKVQEVNTAQQSADQLVHRMLTGEDVNQAEVLTSVQKADMAFRLMLQMRNKLMDAYREVQQIQI